MKALTLTQPWATLVATGAKRVETRSWRTEYRGPLAIHAAKTFPRAARDFACSEPVVQALTHGPLGQWLNPNWCPEYWPRGAVVAIVELTDVISTNHVDEAGSGRLFGVSVQELGFGNYAAGRWAWVFGDTVERLKEPVPARGALGLWEWRR